MARPAAGPGAETASLVGGEARVNPNGPGVVVELRIEPDLIWVIPRKTARTAKATAASKTKRPAPVERVAELTAAGYSAAEIAVKIGCSPRWVRKLRARARGQPRADTGIQPET